MANREQFSTDHFEHHYGGCGLMGDLAANGIDRGHFGLFHVHYIGLYWHAARATYMFGQLVCIASIDAGTTLGRNVSLGRRT